MIIHLRDGGSFYVSEEDGERIMLACNNPNTRIIDLRRLDIDIKGVAPWDIKRFQKGGVDPKVKRIAAPEPAPISEEQRQKNLAALEKMRRDLTAKGIIKPKIKGGR